MGIPIDDDAAALRQVLEIVPGFVLVVDHHGVIRYINRMEPGYVRSEVVGMQASAILFPGSSERFDAALHSVVATGATVDLDVETLAPDGRAAWYRASLSPYREEAGIAGAVITATNVTALKDAEESVAHLRRLLPLCSWCGRLRSDDGTWVRIEEYLHTKEGADVTHGMCPDCARTQLQS
ncbi:MAG: PAS domain-containing protein [Vicinamibacterales bacterium]|nr:PAS domain-containing protein [Vicinamibacterales bacterium]